MISNAKNSTEIKAHAKSHVLSLIFANKMNNGNITKEYLPTLIKVPDEKAANKVNDMKME